MFSLDGAICCLYNNHCTFMHSHPPLDLYKSTFTKAGAHSLTNLIVLLGWCYLLSSCKLFCSLCIALLLAGCLQQILFPCGIIFVTLLSLPAVIRIAILTLHNFFSRRLLLSLSVWSPLLGCIVLIVKCLFSSCSLILWYVCLYSYLLGRLSCLL